MRATTRPSKLLAYRHMLETIEAMVPLLERIATRSRDLANQLERAAASVTLNLAESCGARRGNRVALRHVALGSLYEVMGALDTAVALRYVARGECSDVQRELARLASMVEALVG